MFIQTEDTPNPATLKFLPGAPVMQSGVVDFETADAAQTSPLATMIFGVGGVERVFLGADFISVTKAAEADWRTLKIKVIAAIVDHDQSGLPIVAQSPEAAPTDSEADSDIIKQIKELLDFRVRPAVARDGGDITFHSFEPDTGIVRLNMRGSCAGCPSSTMTLKAGIENMFRHFIPEVSRVEQVI